MAANNEVKVVLGLDDSKARQQLKSFFGEVGKTGQVKDPFAGLDKKFQAVAEQAKKLGFEWDAATKKFKNDGGFTQNLGQMQKTLQTLGGTNKKTAKDFDQLAQRIKGSADAWKFITDGARQYQQQQQGVSSATAASEAALKKLGATAKTAGTDTKLLGTSAAQLKTSLSSLKGDTGLGKVGTDAKTAGGSVKGLSADAKVLGTSLKSLKGDTGLSKVGTDAKGAEGATRALGLGIKTLGGNLKATGAQSSSLKPLGNTLQGINANAKTAGTGLGSVAQKLREVGNSKSGLQTIPPAFQKVSASAKTAATDAGKLKPAFQSAGSQAKTFGDSVRSSFNNILQGIPQGIGLAIGQFLIAPLKNLAQVAPQAISEFSKLDETIQLTLSIVGASADEFGRLQQSILKVSSVTAATAQEVGNVAQALSRAGFSLEEIDDALEGIVKGAEATGTSYEDMGKIVVSALGAFGLAAADAADVADTLTVAANGANTDVLELGDALKYVAPIANAVGQNLQETSLQLQVLANSGIKASTAGTSLRTILTNLQIAAGGASEEFTALSRGSARMQKAIALIGADLTDTNGELKTGKELITALSASMSDLDPGERAIISKVLAGSEGLPALNALISASGQELDDFAEALDNRMGKAADTADQALSGLSGSFKLLQSNVSAALIEIGSVIAAVLKPLVDTVTAIISALNQLPGPIKTAAVAMGVLGAAIGAVVVTMNTLKGTIVATFAASAIQSIKNFVTALSAANIQNSIANMVNGLKNLGGVLKGQVIKGMVEATRVIKSFTAALKSGAAVKAFTGFLDAIGKGFRGIGTAGKATQLTLDFAGAAGKAGTAAGGLKGALPGLAAAFGGAGKAAAAGGVGVAGAGAAAAGAAPAVAGLGASLGGLLAALGPIAAVVGAVALAFVYLKDRLDAYKEIVDPLKESQETLEDGLRDQGVAVDGLGIKYQSWGKAMEDALGPLDRILTFIMPVYHAVKLLAEALGRLNEWDRANQQVIAATIEHQKFKGALDRTNAVIEENRKKMALLNPASEEYGKLAAENTKLIGGEKTAIEQRIKAIDGQIAKLKENEGANGRQIAQLEKMKSEYQGQLPVIEANNRLLREEEKAHEDATGKIKNFTAAMAEAAEAREKAYAKADTKVIQTELKALNDLKKGLISEAEQRAINAKAAAEASNEKITAVEREIAELDRMYSEGGITQEEYTKAVEAATKDIQKEIADRVKAEQDAAKATAAAIDAALQEYSRLVNDIGSAVQQVNSMLGELGNIGSAGVSAFKGLADSITNYRIQGADKVKDRELKNIDASYARQKDIYQKLGKDTAALDKQQAADKHAVEMRYAAKRKSIMQEQIDFEAKAVKAQIKQKEIELQLWYAQQTVANQIAQTQAEVAILSAKANGASPEQISALEKIKRLYGEQETFLQEAYDLKKDIVHIEGLTAKQQLNTKAAAEGVTSEFGNQVSSVGQVESAMDSFLSKVDGTRTRLERIGDGLEPIPDKARQVAEEVKRRIEQGVAGTDFSSIREEFIRAGVSPELADQQARVIVSAYSDAGRDAGNAAATNIADRFGADGTIPKELIKQQLINAMVQGADISVKEAKARFDRMPDAMPTEQVAKIIGNAVGGGYDEGLAILKQTPLPEGLFRGLGENLKTEVGNAGTQSVNTLNTVMGQGGLQAAQSFGNQLANSISPAISMSGDILRQFGIETGLTMGGELSGGITGGIAAGVDESKPPLDNLLTITQNMAGQINPAFKLAFESIGALGLDAGTKAGENVKTGALGSVDPLGSDITQVVGQGIVNSVTGNIVPALQQVESQFGIFGAQAAFIFGEENVAAIGQALSPMNEIIVGIFGDAGSAIGQAGQDGANGFITATGELIPYADQNAKTIGQKYKDLIPKEEIADELQFALGDGTLRGEREAAEIIAKMPDAIPRETIAKIIGDSLGMGVEDGQKMLDAFVLTPEAARALTDDTAGALEEGVETGAENAGEQVKNSGIKEGVRVGLEEGIREGFTTLESEGKKSSENLEGLFTKAGTKSGENFADVFTKKADGAVKSFAQSFDRVDFKGISENLRKQLNEPIGKAAEDMKKIQLSPNIGSDATAIQNMATAVGQSGMGKEFRDANTAAKGMRSSTNSAKGAATSLLGTWRRIRAEAERAARAAQRTGGRALGGPVQGGQTYTVNEYGKEMFLSNSGKLSEIKAPAWGDWRAPTSGTVIPANISAQIRENRQASKADHSMAMLQSVSGPTAARPSIAQDGRGFEQALIRELSKMSGAQGAVTNNVSITSATPVSDVSKVMADLARLRAMRRR